MYVYHSFVKESNRLSTNGSLDSCLEVARLFLECHGHRPYRFTPDTDVPAKAGSFVLEYSMSALEHFEKITRHLASYLFVVDALVDQRELELSPAEYRTLVAIKSFLGHVYKMREKGASRFFFCNLNTGRSYLLENSFRD